MNQSELDEDDFSDLDAIISEAEDKRVSSRSINNKTRRLAANISDEERLRLVAEVRRHEDLYVWQTQAQVALFHTQVCLTCTHKHRFFMGWMTLQQHRNDPNCRRYVRGRSDLELPARIEEHAQADVEICSDCAESSITIEAIVRGINVDLEAKQSAALLVTQREKRERQEEEGRRIQESAQ